MTLKPSLGITNQTLNSRSWDIFSDNPELGFDNQTVKCIFLTISKKVVIFLKINDYVTKGSFFFVSTTLCWVNGMES